MPPTKRAKARKKVKVRASIKRQSRRQKVKAVKRNRTNKKSKPLRIPSNFNINRRPKSKSKPKPQRKRSNNLRHLLNKYNYMNVGARQPSSNLIRFDTQEREDAQKHIMARRTQNLRNFLNNYEKTHPGKLYNILPSQRRDYFDESDKKVQQTLRLRNLGKAMLKNDLPVDELTEYSKSERKKYNIDPYDLDAELGITSYNESKSRGIKKSVIDRIRGRE